MTRNHLIASALLLLVWAAGAHAQYYILPSPAILNATRAGFFGGINQSIHHGDVPFAPDALGAVRDINDASSTNFIFGVHLEKAVSRTVVLGARLTYDQMSINADGRITQPFRIADETGQVYDVVTNNTMDYAIRYLSIQAVAKLHLYRTYGFYFVAGVSLGTLIGDEFDYGVSVEDPEWAQGSVGPGSSGDIANIGNYRFALVPGMGYDFYFRGMFVSPEILGDIPLTNVLDKKPAGSKTDWKIYNIRVLLRFSFVMR